MMNDSNKTIIFPAVQEQNLKIIMNYFSGFDYLLSTYLRSVPSLAVADFALPNYTLGGRFAAKTRWILSKIETISLKLIKYN